MNDPLARLMALERVLPIVNKCSAALVVITDAGKDPEHLIGVYRVSIGCTVDTIHSVTLSYLAA